MPRRDTSDFLTAFAVGTVLGIGATLLLKPEPRSAKERLMRELKPYGKKLRRSAVQVHRGVASGRAATRDVAGDAIDAGHELLAEFRDEIRRVVAEARDELHQAVEERRDGERRGRERRGGERRDEERRGAGRRFRFKPSEG